jgi:hypothetical protein
VLACARTRSAQSTFVSRGAGGGWRRRLCLQGLSSESAAGGIGRDAAVAAAGGGAFSGDRREEGALRPLADAVVVHKRDLRALHSMITDGAMSAEVLSGWWPVRRSFGAWRRSSRRGASKGSPR